MEWSSCATLLVDLQIVSEKNMNFLKTQTKTKMNTGSVIVQKI